MSSGLPHMADVSHWQGPVDWKAEKRRGLAACYVNVGQGMTYTDPTAARRIRNATFARIPVGAYLFLTPGVGSGEAQADRLLKMAPLRPGQLRPCLDFEWNQLHLNNQQLAAWLLGAVTRIHTRTGYFPTIYGSPGILSPVTTIHPEVFGRCPLWVANYGVSRPTVPAPWTSWAAWQWTETYKDPAVGTRDDSFVADLAALKIPVTAKAIGAAVRL